jgi:iron complex outermembrane receptor protein
LHFSFFSKIIFVNCAALLITSAAGAASDTGAVKGVVTDDSGAAVVGALLRLHQIAGSAALTTYSDRTGHYVFSSVSPGEYLLDASASGLAAVHSLTLTLTESETKTVPVALSVSTVRTEVSVTAADEPQSVDHVSKALDTVNAADAQERGIVSVPDAVSFLPGLRVATSGGPGALTTIQSRGLPPEDTAILIDGFRFRDPTSVKGDASGQIGDLLLVDSSNIDVLRGSGSSLYGTNAVAGTVNIITDSGGGPVRGDVDVQGGGLGLFRGVAHAAGGAFENRLTWSAGLANLNVSNGVDDAAAVRNWSGQGTLLYAVKPNLRVGFTEFAKTGFAQLNVSPETTSTAPTTGVIPAIPLSNAARQLADANLSYDPGSATFVPSLGDGDSGVRSHFASSLLRLEHEVNSRLSYRIAYAFVDSLRNYNDGPAGPSSPFSPQPQFITSSQYTGRIGTLQARVNYLLGSHQVLTAGYEHEQEHYLEFDTDFNPDVAARSLYRANAQQRSDAAFAQDEIRLFDGRLQVLLSGRFTAASLDQPSFVNAPSAYSSEPLPSPPSAYTGDASIAYFFRRSSTKVRSHVGNSFRLPSLYERFGTSLFDGFASAYGDPRLSPERTVSVDGGIDQYLFHDHLKVSGTYFYAHLQQVIGFLSFPPDYVDPYGRSAGYYNTGGGISRGVELSGEFRPTNKTTVTTSYTYTNAKDRTSQYYTGLPVSPLQSARIEPNVVKIVALQQFGQHVDLAMDFEGGSDYLYPLDGYAYQFAGPRQLGLTAGYSLQFTEKTTTRFYVRVSNALGQEYYENGFRTPARWAVAGIRFGF